MTIDAWKSVKDAAQKLKDELNKAAHTSPADAADSVTKSTKAALDQLMSWVEKKKS